MILRHPSLLALTLLLADNRHRALGFTTSAVVPPSLQHAKRSGSSASLQAVVYGPDGNIVKEEDQKDNSNGTDDLPLHVLYGIQAEVDAATLAKIACANAPPPHDHIALEDVKQAILVGVTSTSIDVALSLVASSPDDDDSNQQLLQVLVTVPFEQAAAAAESYDYVKEVEQHVLQQIRQLDDEAAAEGLEQEEEPTSSSSVPEQLTEEPTMDVQYAVDWWTTVPPLKTFLRDEADSFKTLLNAGNDFQKDLQKLVQRQISDKSIKRVQVASIGTSGIWLKAAMVGDVDNDTSIMDVSIPFLDGKEAITADDLRENVLTLVESVESIPLEEEEAGQPAVQDIQAVEEEEETPAESAGKEAPKEEQPSETGSAPSSAPPMSKEERTIRARRQPKPATEEAELAAKYAAIEDLGERAYTILLDLGMI